MKARLWLPNDTCAVTQREACRYLTTGLQFRHIMPVLFQDVARQA
jgi:hypothetical protein